MVTVSTTPSRKLQLGCGSHLLPGWINTDLQSRPGVEALDVTQPFPFEEASLDVVVSEHLIEHLSFAQAEHMLSECFRVLKSGGTVRVATPDLAFLLDLMQEPRSPTQQRYIEWALKTFQPQVSQGSACHVLNHFVRAWGHRFIFDEATLRSAMNKAGFDDLRRCSLGQSRDAAIEGISPTSRIPREFLTLETMVYEGTKRRRDPEDSDVKHNSQPRLLIGVMTCPGNEERMRAVRETWLATPLPDDVRFLEVRGGLDGTTPRLEGDVLHLPVREAYEHLPLKTWLFLRFCREHFEFDHLLKCDDDTWVNVPRLLKQDFDGGDYIGSFSRPVRKVMERWHYGKCRDPFYEVPFSGPFPHDYAEGFGYLLSPRAVSEIAELPLSVVEPHLYEDTFVGWILERTSARDGIRKHEIGREFVAKRGESASRAILRHPVSPSDMLANHSQWWG